MAFTIFNEYKYNFNEIDNESGESRVTIIPMGVECYSRGYTTIP
jgi:hypothetical protein